MARGQNVLRKEVFPDIPYLLFAFGPAMSGPGRYSNSESGMVLSVCHKLPCDIYQDVAGNAFTSMVARGGGTVLFSLAFCDTVLPCAHLKDFTPRDNRGVCGIHIPFIS